MKAAQTLRAEIVAAAKADGILTQVKLANALGYSPQYISDLFKPGRKALTPTIVKKAARRFKVDAAMAQRWQHLGALESGWQIGEPQ